MEKRKKEAKSSWVFVVIVVSLSPRKRNGDDDLATSLSSSSSFRASPAWGERAAPLLLIAPAERELVRAGERSVEEREEEKMTERRGRRGRLDYGLMGAEMMESWGTLGQGYHGLPLLILHQMVPKAKLDQEVEAAIHTAEVAVNGRSASP